MPMPDPVLPLRAQASMPPPPGWSAQQLSALDAISRAVRELTGSLAGFQDAWQAAARQALAATMTTSSVALAAREPAPPRCWRCEIAGESAVPAGPSPSGLRVDLCDACLAHMADPDSSSDRAIAGYDQAARKELADRAEDRAAAEGRAAERGLGRVDEDA